MTKQIVGDLQGKGLRIGIVVARFNAEITEALLQGSLAALQRVGVAKDDVIVLHVPGAFELPGAALKLARKGLVDAVICLGAVIRGGTPHFDYVCDGATAGILQAGLDTGIPVIFGLLTCDNVEQALERAGLREPEGGWSATVDHVSGGAAATPVERNKGAECALCAVEMASLHAKIDAEAAQ